MTREVEDCPQLVAATSIGISKMTDIILLRKRLPYIDQLCEDKGIVGEPVIFQTKENKAAKRTSIIVVEGKNERERPERALYWILGEILSPDLACFFIIDNL